MWWPGDQQWVSSSECTGTWGRGGVAASEGGEDGELLLLGQGQHHWCPAWLEWDPLGYTHHPTSSLGWELCLGQSHSCIFLPRRKDHIVMVNGLSMENVPSSFAIQTLKTCGKIANIVSVLCAGMGPASCSRCACPHPSSPVPHTPRVWGLAIAAGRDSCTHHPLLLALHLQTLKRPKKIHVPVSKSSPGSPAVARHYDSDDDSRLHRSRDDLDHSQGYDGDSSSERSSGHHRHDRRHHKPVSRSRRRSQDSSHGFGPDGDTNGLALVSGFKRLPRQDVPMKPITSVLVKQKQNEGEALLLLLSLGLAA